tara:strand:+ start:1040 stop:1270 length:231 start_codon:yes stop_codon:yes gene_type:complete
MIIEHYAGSVSFDTEDLERDDQMVTALRYKDLVDKIQRLMKQRKNSEVHFAVRKTWKKEFDLTNKVRREVQDAMGS